VTPAEYGQALALTAPPLTNEQREAAARILASVELEDVAA
jgi:ribosome recycling factor